MFLVLFFFQAEDGIRDWSVTGVQTCALPISRPIARADMGPTNPEAGVIATRPATDPEIAPSTLGFPLRAHSAPAQPRAAAAAPRSEERRVGKGCRARWEATHERKKEQEDGRT